MTVNVFAVPVFFICFRECLETSIIVSVLLSFLKQTLPTSPTNSNSNNILHKRLVRQVWLGVALGLLICAIVGAGMIGAFYTVGKDHFAGTEDIWEGTFGLLATVIISVVGAALLRVSKLQEKWRVKMAVALEKKDTDLKKGGAGGRFKRWCERYAMFLLPFVTVLREGLEAVVFIGGVGLGLPATSFPLAVISGLVAGCLVGYLIYRGGSTAKLQLFLILSTCFLYLVAAGLFSKAVWFFETNTWNHLVGGDTSETGSGPGSYDIRQSVWHVNCCNPNLNGGGGWGIFNSILGWTNSATYGSVLAYNLYWGVVMVVFGLMRFTEREGRWPFMKAKAKEVGDDTEDVDSDSQRDSGVREGEIEKLDVAEVARPSTTVRELTV